MTNLQNLSLENLTPQNLAIIALVLLLLYFIYTLLFTQEEVETFYVHDSPVAHSESDSSKIKMYNFNTTWCGYSKQFQPIWDQFAASVNNLNVLIKDMKCDDDKHQKLMEKYNVEGFPTVVVVNGDKVSHYNGERSVEGLMKALNKELGNVEVQTVVHQNNTILYNFNTTWCGYSKQFQPIWDEFARLHGSPSLSIIDVKCDNEQHKDLCEKYKVEGYPTVVRVRGDAVDHYTGPRTIEGLLAFSK